MTGLTTTAIGQSGEQQAMAFLKEKGFEVVALNYRFKRAEVDLIVRKENWLVFIEVKKRKNSRYGLPEDFVSNKKVELVHSAAVNYIETEKWKGNIRFDVISICGNEVLHLQDAF